MPGKNWGSTLGAPGHAAGGVTTTATSAQCLIILDGGHGRGSRKGCHHKSCTGSIGGGYQGDGIAAGTLEGPFLGVHRPVQEVQPILDEGG